MIDEGYIKVTGKKVKSGSVAIELYQGNSSIKLASTTVTVEDTRAKITSATFQGSIPTIYSAAGINLDNYWQFTRIKFGKEELMRGLPFCSVR